MPGNAHGARSSGEGRYPECVLILPAGPRRIKPVVLKLSQHSSIFRRSSQFRGDINVVYGTIYDEYVVEVKAGQS
jgi:hypothetical protein